MWKISKMLEQAVSKSANFSLNTAQAYYRGKQLRLLLGIGCLLLLNIVFANTQETKNVKVPRAALVYSEYANADGKANRDAYDETFEHLGWIIDKWENKNINKLVEKLDDYDLVICSMNYNSANAQDFGKYGKEWLKYMTNGGCLIVESPRPDASMDWLAQMDSSFRLKLGKIPYIVRAGDGAKYSPNNKIRFKLWNAFPDQAEFNEWSPTWILPFIYHAPGTNPTLMYQEVGKGLCIVSTDYAVDQSKLGSTVFPVEEDFNAIWNFLKTKSDSKIIRQGKATCGIKKPATPVTVLEKRKQTIENLKLTEAEKTQPFALSVATTFDKVLRDNIWNGTKAAQLDFQMAANEYESAQVIVVPSGSDLRAIKVTCSDLMGNSGKIDSSNIEIRRVAYVLAPRINNAWLPDPLIKNRIFDISNEQVVQPMWITVHIPPGSKAGNYKGELTVQSSSPEGKTSLPLSVKVWDFEIPKELNLSTDAGFSLADASYMYYGDKKKFKTYFPSPQNKNFDNLEKYISPDECRKFLQIFFKYRITPALRGPWTGSLCGLPYLTWRMEGDNVKFDFTEFDKTAEFILSNGGKCIYAGDIPITRTEGYYAITAKDDQGWKKYIPNIYAHLKEKGWLDLAYFNGNDEPQEKDVEKVERDLALLKKIAPGLQCRIAYFDIKFFDKYRARTLAEPQADKNNSDVIWSTHVYAMLIDENYAKRVKEVGKAIWPYDSAGSSLRINSPNVEKRDFLWDIRKFKGEGLILWALQSWIYTDNTVADLEEDGTPKKSWKISPNDGDAYLVYPAGKKLEDGLNPSIRLEMMRDGFEDWEYFRILENRLSELKKKNSKNHKELIGETEKLMEIPLPMLQRSFIVIPNTSKKEQMILTKRQQIAEQIEKINRILENNQKD